MPRIPETFAVGLSAPGVVPMQAPGVQPVQDFAGRQASQLGHEALGLGMAQWSLEREQQEQIDTAQAKELDNQVAESFRGILTKYSTQLGKNAVDSHDAIAQELRDARRLVEGQAKTPGQQAMLRLTLDKRQMAAMGDIDTHYTKQQTVWNIGVSKARADGFGVDAVRASMARNDDLFAENKARMESELAVGLGLEGMPIDSEPGQAVLLQRRTQLHAEAVAGIADQEPERAAEHLRRYEGEIDPGTLTKLRARVQDSGTKKKSLDTMFAIVGESAKAGGTLDEQRARAMSTAEWTYRGKKLTAEEYDQVVDRLNRHYTQQDRAQSAADVQVIVEAEKWRNDNPGLPMTDFPGFNAAKERGLLGKMRDAEAVGSFTDPQFVDQLRGADLTQIDPVKLARDGRRFLSPQDMEHWQAKIAQARGSATPKQRKDITIRDRFDDAMSRLGWITPDMDEKDRRAAQAKIESYRIQFFDSLPPDATDDQVRARLSEIVVDTAMPKGGGDGKPYANLTEQERQSRQWVFPVMANGTNYQVPTDEAELLMPTGARLESIRRQLQADNVTATRSEILRKHAETEKMQGRDLFKNTQAGKEALADEVERTIQGMLR